MTILVTGASGYVGTQLVAALLRGGSGSGAPRPVRAQVHSAAREDGLRAAVRQGVLHGKARASTPDSRSSPPT